MIWKLWQPICTIGLTFLTQSVRLSECCFFIFPPFFVPVPLFPCSPVSFIPFPFRHVVSPGVVNPCCPGYVGDEHQPR